MNGAVWFGLGLVVGVGVAFHLRPPLESSCCRRVAAGVRDRVGEIPIFGRAGQVLGDALDAWNQAPSILDTFGVRS